MVLQRKTEDGEYIEVSQLGPSDYFGKWSGHFTHCKLVIAVNLHCKQVITVHLHCRLYSFKDRMCLGIVPLMHIYTQLHVIFLTSHDAGTLLFPR